MHENLLLLSKDRSNVIPLFFFIRALVVSHMAFFFFFFSSSSSSYFYFRVWSSSLRASVLQEGCSS